MKKKSTLSVRNFFKSQEFVKLVWWVRYQQFTVLVILKKFREKVLDIYSYCLHSLASW